MGKINILLVEDDPVWRDCLVAYIENEQDFSLIGSAATKEDAIRIFSENDVDVVLMDILLTQNNYDGLDAVIELQAIKPVKVIMLTFLDENEVIMDAFAVGAINYIVKTHFKQIPDAVRAAYRDESSIHADAAKVIREEIGRMKSEEMRRMLTPAEKEILGLINEGHSKSQITGILRITQSTIKTHVRRIVKKFGVKTGKEAAKKAKRRGLF